MFNSPLTDRHPCARPYGIHLHYLRIKAQSRRPARPAAPGAERGTDASPSGARARCLHQPYSSGPCRSSAEPGGLPSPGSRQVPVRKIGTARRGQEDCRGVARPLAIGGVERMSAPIRCACSICWPDRMVALGAMSRQTWPGTGTSLAACGAAAKVIVNDLVLALRTSRRPSPVRRYASPASDRSADRATSTSCCANMCRTSTPTDLTNPCISARR